MILPPNSDSPRFLSQNAVATASCLVVTLSSRAFGLIEHTGMLHFGGLLWLYGCWMICVAFLIASCFKSSKAMFLVGPRRPP